MLILPDCCSWNKVLWHTLFSQAPCFSWIIIQYEPTETNLDKGCDFEPEKQI